MDNPETQVTLATTQWTKANQKQTKNKTKTKNHYAHCWIYYCDCEM